MQRGSVFQDLSGFKTYVEEVPDHDCYLDIQDVVDEVLLGGGFPSRRRRCIASIQRTFLVSRKHPYTSVAFKSTNSITQEIMRHRREAPSTIHPYSEFRSAWEVVLICYYLMIYSFLPFNISFNSHHAKEFHMGNFEYQAKFYTLFIFLLFGYVEIFVNFFTGYVSSDGLEFVLEKKRIAKHYLKTFFIFDFFSAFPYGFVLLGFDVLTPETEWIEYLGGLKLVRIISFVSYYRQITQRLHFGYRLQKIVGILLGLVLYLHWVACLLNMFSTTGLDFSLIHDKVYQLEQEKKPVQQQTWLVKSKALEYMARYNGWSILLMRGLCLTFGIKAPIEVSQIIDLVPNITFALLGIIATSIITVQVVLTTRRGEAATTTFEDLQSQLREYLHLKKVPRALNRRIAQYFRFCYERSFYKETSILFFLSGQLRQDVLLHKSRRLLETVEIFADLPPLLAVRLMSCMKEQVALGNEVVVQAGSLEDRMYYILTGTVAVYSDKGCEILHLGEGEHFGERALLADDLTWTLSIVALETTRMWTLSRDAFKHALSPDKAYLKRVDEKARARLGLGRGGTVGAFRAPIPQFVEHLRRMHRTAKFQRRHRERLVSRNKSFREHEAQPEIRQSEPYPHPRRRAEMDAPSSASFRRSSTPA